MNSSILVFIFRKLQIMAIKYKWGPQLIALYRINNSVRLHVATLGFGPDGKKWGPLLTPFQVSTDRTI
jgi:hypothetical protein